MSAPFVTSTVKLDFPKIQRLSKEAVTALEQTADALLTEVKNAEVMPFKTGNLQNESTFTDYTESSRGRVRIISSTPYARRLYYHPEYNFNREFNANAGAEWFAPWLKGGKHEDFAEKTFEKIYKRLCKL